MSAECVNRSCSCDNMAAVRNATSNEVFLTSIQGDAVPIDNQGIATLYHYHVLIEFMNVFRRDRGLRTSPERHLALVGSVKHVAFDAGSRLTGADDFVRRIPHELRKFFHAERCYRICAWW
jgi:hypothetical protein